MSTIWAFDLGKGSIGEAIWDDSHEHFLHHASLLIPSDFASTTEAAARRRMLRTRQAHRAREAWLQQVWQDAGLQPLLGRRVQKINGHWQLIHPGDPRLEREFPAKGDTTCYTSCLLRIKLLRDEPLAPWQIYKALHSAIQKRGYDPDIAWKTRSKKNPSTEDDEAATLQRMQAFEKQLTELFPDPAYQLPCYYDAYHMHLWHPQQPHSFKDRIDHTALHTRNRILPRTLVEKEIRLLAEAAGRQLPALAGKASYLLYGPAGTAYASYHKEQRLKHHLRQGSHTDWQGVLGQKVPRFDNRIIDKCTLIPRLNVCKIRSDDQRAHGENGTLPQEVTFLMKLKNMRVQRTPTEQTGLTAAEISQAFETYKDKGWKLTETQWRKFCLSIGAQPVAPVLEVEPPKAAGRSRFCRPALAILKRLILSGNTPPQAHAAELARLQGNTQPHRGLVPADLQFMLDMGPTWEKLYIPNQKLEALAQRTADSEAAILELIGSQNDPIVRHRLGTFWRRLQHLQAQHGPPSEVVIEFVREDFMGEKALIKYRQDIKRREKERLLAREEAAKHNLGQRSAPLKLELLRLQNGECIYTGESLSPTEIEAYEIDHIVPRALGGSDAMVNYVLTKKEHNQAKSNRTPFQWLSNTQGWDTYVKRVKKQQTSLGFKKARLLTSPDAPALIEKYTALAETAWIAKLAQTLVGLQFGWKNGVDSHGEKRIRIISGGLTARIRRKYKLNSLLAPPGTQEQDAEKNRSDHRHHALDAMVLAFIPAWARHPDKERWFRFPTKVEANARGFFGDCIQRVEPQNLHLTSSRLEATAYGLRHLKRDTHSTPAAYAVGREPLTSLLVKTTNGKETLKPVEKADTKRIVDATIRQEVEAFLAAHPTLTLEQWHQWCASYRIRGRGPRVVKVLMTKTKADGIEEYVDVSKDGTHQLRRGESHRGYYVYQVPAPSKKEPEKKRAVVRPVYAFQSPASVLAELRAQGITDAQFFESGCTVHLDAPVAHPKTPLSPGNYILNSIWSDGRAKVTNSHGHASEPINLNDLIKAHFKRIK